MPYLPLTVCKLALKEALSRNIGVSKLEGAVLALLKGCCARCEGRLLR